MPVRLRLTTLETGSALNTWKTMRLCMSKKKETHPPLKNLGGGSLVMFAPYLFRGFKTEFGIRFDG